MSIFKLILISNIREIENWIESENTNKRVFSGPNDTPLIFAISEHRRKVAKLFIKRELYIQDVNFYGSSPLHYSAARGFTKLILLLLEKGAEVNIQNREGNSPLHISALNAQFGATSLLIDNGANINVLNRESFTPLLLAMSIPTFGSFEVIKFLLDEGASLLNVEHDRVEKECVLFDYAPLTLLVKNNLKLQKFIVNQKSKKILNYSNVILKFLKTFKISFKK